MSQSLEDIFGKQPKKPEQGPPSSQGATGTLLSSILAVALGAVLCWLVVGRIDFGDKGKQDEDRKQDRQEQAEPSPTPAVKEGYLLFIHERRQITADQADMLDAAAAYCSDAKGVSFRSLDQDDPNEKVQEAKAFAESKGIKPPCLVFKDLDNKLRNAIAFPKTLPEMLKVMN